jgi:hypothetical protein
LAKDLGDPLSRPFCSFLLRFRRVGSSCSPASSFERRVRSAFLPTTALFDWTLPATAQVVLAPGVKCRLQLKRRVAHSANEMFGLDADEERYPEIVPVCQLHTIRTREINCEAGLLTVEMTVAFCKYLR